MRGSTTVRFKKIKIQDFADQRHQQGWENTPRGAINIYKIGLR